MPNWFVVRDGEEQGPLSSGQLRKLVLAGQVRPDDLLRRDDIAKPIRAGSVKGLFEAEAAKAGKPLEPAQDQETSESADIPPVQHPTPEANRRPADSSTSATPGSAGISPSLSESADAVPTAVSMPAVRKTTGKRVLNQSVGLGTARLTPAEPAGW